MAVRLYRNSRLRFGNLLQKDGVEFWDMLELPTIPERSDDIMYTVTDLDRIDSLAFRFYGDPTLWWVIAAANSMEILPTDFRSDTVIRVPAPNFVLNELFSKAKVK